MKIDKRTCPILFDKISFTRLGLTKFVKISDSNNGDLIPKEIRQNLENIANSCTSNIMFITQPILEAFDYGDQKTIDRLISLRNEIKDIERCVIWKVGSSTCTTLYNFYKQDSGTTFVIVWQQKDKEREPVNFHVAGYWKKEWEEHNKFAISGSCSHDVNVQLLRTAFTNHAELVVQCEVFLQYAEIETKLLKSNSKDSILCKYNNKTPFPITIVDSTWYTNLVKSDSFKVRGHFRLQPYGHGLKERKLIWINEFQKECYNREAKMLSHSF